MINRLRIAFAAALLLVAAVAHGHDHIEVGVDATDTNRLALSGPAVQLALFVPVGEPFSGYLPQFPGGWFAVELTFSAEGNVIEFATGSRPRVEIVSVTGPAGGTFSFWELGATQPTFSRFTGWTSAASDRPSIIVYEDNTGYGHIHGRAFTFDAAGDYQVVFRAVDDAGLRTPSATKSVTFHVLNPPPLSIRAESGIAKLSFTSRLGLTYDLQVSTDLVTWRNVTSSIFIDGTGESIPLEDPIAERPRVFYRLVEYL